jgi:nucleotide-binding universal stress UspA family protein
MLGRSARRSSHPRQSHCLSDEMTTSSARHVAVLIDSSADSMNAWSWTKEHILRSSDNVHLLSVAQIDDEELGVDVLDETVGITGVSAAAFDETALQEARRKSAEKAEHFIEELMKAEEDKSWSISGAVFPMHGSVGETILEQLKKREVDYDFVVVGSRGIGAFKRSLLSLVGLGSVSDYCVRNLPYECR